jgi:hypothetical protein
MLGEFGREGVCSGRLGAEAVLPIVRQALNPGGKISVVVFSTPQVDLFLVKPMQILLRQAGKTPCQPAARHWKEKEKWIERISITQKVKAQTGAHLR